MSTKPKNVGEFLKNWDLAPIVRLHIEDIREAYAGDLAEMERLRKEIERIRDVWLAACGERDALKAELEETQRAVAYGNSAWKAALDERDALKAEVERLQAKQLEAAGLYDQQYEDLRQQLAEAKAEAEQLKFELGKARELSVYNANCGAHHSRELFLLRSRIEALADEWEEYGTYPQAVPDIRALLSPPKEETALEWIARMQDHVDADTEGSVDWQGELAKLRELLEKEGGK